GFETSVLSKPITDLQVLSTILLSPDESRVAIAFWSERTLKVEEFELANGRLHTAWEPKKHNILYSPQGKLLAISDLTLRELDSDCALRELPAIIDEFYFQYTLGDFAIYQKVNHVRLYSWHTGQLVAEHDFHFKTMGVSMVSRNGQVVEVEGCKPDGS